MLRKLRRWARLEPVDRAAVAEAWLLLLLARIAVRRVDLDRAQRLLAGVLPRRRPRESTAHAAARLARWVGVAAANQLPAQCLERALVLRAMLTRRGHDALLRIGVRRDGDRLEAHAWVECDGEPIADGAGENGGYSPLLPAAETR